MRETESSQNEPNHRQIISIINHKQLNDGTFKFQVQWENSSKKTWEFSYMVEERHVETYWSEIKNQPNIEFQQKKSNQEISDDSDEEEICKEKQLSKKEEQNMKAKKFIKKKNMKIISNLKTIPQENLLPENYQHGDSKEKDNFMNESSVDEKLIKEKEESNKNISTTFESNPIPEVTSQKIFPCASQKNETKSNEKIDNIKSIEPMHDHTIELVAEVESSEDLESEPDSNISNPIFRRVGKEPKMKVSKHKTKYISKVQKRKLKDLDEENILEEKRKTKNNKNYKEVDPKIPATEKVKSINFANVTKECTKLEHVEDLLISHIIESAMIGKCKFFKVKLKNGDCVFLRENNMRQYFPRKLQQYYQEILNKLSMCSRSANFAL